MCIRDSNGSIKILLFVAVFSAIMSTPIALSIDWVVQHILAAPLQKGGASYADDDVVNNDQERSFAWVVVGSRASAVTSATMTATTTTGSSRSSDNTTWVSLK